MDGVLLFNKPTAWTSHDAVDFVRRCTGQRSVGHAGTLDPMATGLLVILIGRATKLSAALSGLDKDYTGSILFGVSTDTQDTQGKVLTSTNPGIISREVMEKLFADLSGPQLQTPPAFSAVRKNGKKLYQWAREGVAVEAEPREIFVKEFRVTGFNFPTVSFFMSCSKGTYVRTLAHEAGKRAGVGAALSALCRTRIGPFRLEAALDRETLGGLSPEEIQKQLTAHENLSRV